MGIKGTGERRNKTCQLLIDLVSSCVLKLDNASGHKRFSVSFSTFASLTRLFLILLQ